MQIMLDSAQIFYQSLCLYDVHLVETIVDTKTVLEIDLLQTSQLAQITIKI